MMTSSLTIYAAVLALLWAIGAIARHDRRERRAQDMHLWLHPTRPAPAGWIAARDAAHVIDILNLGAERVTAISLGFTPDTTEAYGVVRHVAALAANGKYAPKVLIEAEDETERMRAQTEVAMIRNNQLWRLGLAAPAPFAAA